MEGSLPTPVLCRACGEKVQQVFLDLGQMPLANAYPRHDDPAEEEHRYPLRARVCEHCWLVQLDHDISPDLLFADYAYFSSYSESWLRHAETFATESVTAWGLGPCSLVVEIASNDGYLLRHFVDREIPVLGIEPAGNVAEVARQAGVETMGRFFGRTTAAELRCDGRRADLLVANNVLAHVPDLRDFVEGITTVLAPSGVVSLEFPHLLRLMQGLQFDTIYHEHFSYLSLLAVERLFDSAGLRIFDVVELPTHGGSLRVLAEHGRGIRPIGDGVRRVRADERMAGLDHVGTYVGFAARVEDSRAALRRFLDDARSASRQVVGYGAAAKGNTLLNYCYATPEDIAYVVDRSPHKQGRLLPGSRIPIRAPAAVNETQPDFLLILPWNLRDEVMSQMVHIRQWGGRFVVAIPDIAILP